MARKKIKLSQLRANTENYRFEPLEDDDEAIDYMIANQKDKLLNLAKDIIEWGLNPHEDTIVCPIPSSKGEYNVLEGNRRVITLKILKNPSLIRGQENHSFKKKFKELQKGIKKNINEIECFVYNDPTKAEHWIGLKHGYGTRGVGTEEWDPLQKSRFEEKTKGASSMILQIIKKMENSKYVPEDIKNKLKKLKTTNLQRLISDPTVRDFLGVKIEKGILKSNLKEEEIMKGLTQIIKDLSDKDFKVKKIYTKKDREDYLKKFPSKSIPIKKEVKKDWEFNGENISKTKNKKEPKSFPIDRNTLIPETCKLRINNARVNKIYYELQTLDNEKFTNACSALLRIFVELSLDCYLEKYNLFNGPSLKKSGLDLQQKVFKVADHLEKKGWADPQICKGIKIAVKDKNNILGIDTWNDYIHNRYFSPSYKDLNRTWDNINKFIEKIWENIK